MTYFIYHQALGHTNDVFEELDGDFDKVENVDQSVDVGINPPAFSNMMRCGRCVETRFLPTKVRAKGRKRRLSDLSKIVFAQFVSEAFRQAVESLEPGVHQFVPVDVLWKDGSSAGSFYWFATRQRLQTLHPDLVHPPIDHRRGSWSRLGEDRRPMKDARLVFDSARIGDHQVWSDIHMDRYIAVSDLFKQAAEEAGLVGIKFAEQETV